MNTRHISILIGLLLIVAASCNKSSNSTTSTPLTSVNDKIASVQIVENGGNTTLYTIQYNAQGQVDSIIQNYSSGIQYTSFEYSSGYYTVTTNAGGGPETSTVLINADGTISSIVKNIFDTTSFSYNSNGVSQTAEENIYFTRYGWVNGDIDSSSSSSSGSTNSSSTFYYDLTHLWQMSDFISIFDFLNYGRPTKKSKHLMTARGSNGTIEKYSYKFDSRSRIIQMTIVDENVTYYYTYTN